MNPEKYTQKEREYMTTPKGRFCALKRSAKYRGMKQELTFEQFLSFWQKPCSYCGDPVSTIGLDQIEAGKGYTVDNVVPCCWKCNRMKNSDPKQDFYDHIRKIMAHMPQEY